MSDLLSKTFTLRCAEITQANISLLHLAGWLANESSDVQAAFFNEFDAQLRRLCDIKEGSCGIAVQCHWIHKGLTPDAKYTLIDIGTDHD